MRLPVETVSHGIRAYTEEDAILNPACAYVLLAVGRASIERGVAMTVPAWGEVGHLTYPNGVSIQIHNRNVLVLRPLGYKLSPSLSLAAVTAESLGVPNDGDYVLYLGSGPHRSGDLGKYGKAGGRTRKHNDRSYD